MKILLKILRSLFVSGPLAVVLGLIQLLFVLVFGTLALFVRLIEILCEFIRRMNLKEEEGENEKCNPPYPEEVLRRPDPCIYSQRYLANQGVSVTWNNPDIWMAKASTPNVIEPDSYHLEENTDYIVNVRCHNASTDLALGVKVRLLYRPWSFNSPELLPVNITADGQEVVRFANIPGMGSAIVQFNWHTPAAPVGEPRHFCLQAHLSHPMDINLENNMGQENTNVHSANPGHVASGEIVDVEVPLFNNGRTEKQFIFKANTYAIDTSKKVPLELRRNTGREPWPLSRKLGSLVPIFRFAQPAPNPSDPNPNSSTTTAGRTAAATPTGPRFTFGRKPRRTVTRARYVGHNNYKQLLLEQDFELPAGMLFEIPGIGPTLQLAPAENRNIPVRIRVPDDAQDGTEYTINVRAEDQDGRLVGGATLLLQVQN
jgi:hypothetical protein